MSDKTWDQWEDALGNTYKPGDIIAIATISGKSPQMVIARVERINRVNGSGEKITTHKWFDHDEPIQRERECYYAKDRSYGAGYYNRPVHECKPACTMYIETGEYRTVPSCTVRATPLMDLRGFSRYGTKEDGTNKAVTYSIAENIILVEKMS